MVEPYYTSTPQCGLCTVEGRKRIATYVVYDAKHRLRGVYCLECARRKVELLRRNA